ncbi:MAG TPA: hypothetical protein PK990_03875 [Salinivirgaceae bacterium]|nr:hypothetical protein [Salinivirgaceae bacterium]
MKNKEQFIEILSVNISKEKGVVKHPVDEVFITECGIDGDAHAGEWHRQISILGEESILRFEKVLGRKIEYGEFAENITSRGLELKDCSIGDQFIGDEVVLEVSQIGKKCHGDGCAIFRQVGNCIMPVEGIFCRVLKGGKVKAHHKWQYIKK